MKYWWSAIVKDYFTFSKRERTGIVILLILAVGAFYIIPRVFHPPTQNIDRTALIKQIAALKITVDSSSPYKSYDRERNDNVDFYHPKNTFNKEVKGELFEFDPNTLSVDGWKRLGVRDKTIQTIQNFINKGYKFRQPEDITKIYGLKQGQSERLLPYVRIAKLNTEIASVAAKPTFANTYVSNKPALSIIDINEADSNAFVALPGIGNKLASRIINFRNRLGGFVTVAQLGETYGLPDSTFQLIRKQLQCEHPVVATINVNTADAKQLKAHPYMTWNIANAIVRYREQHGNYANLLDLQKIEIISPEYYLKISPYLSL
ncbi:MAG: helix-hairpin-helix domain-containing protein [Chitinophagaceae bacterium]|nr:helix-hairpin-helix domain-containing protein [Chitinophagaceae bacterium]